jgi:hypothetical protein
MSLFEIEEVKRKKRKFPKGLLLTGVISAIASLGLAVGALITLSGGDTSTSEFGTGVIVFTGCDSDGITAVPLQSFVTSATQNKFTYNEVTLTGISKDCAGRDLTITIRDENGGILPVSIAEDGRVISSVRFWFQDLTNSPGKVTRNGYFSDMFTLLGPDVGTGLVTVSTVNNLQPTAEVLPTDGNGDVIWNGDNPMTYWQMDPDDNQVTIVFNPSPVTSGPKSGQDQVGGFADARHGYSIVMESIPHRDS